MSAGARTEKSCAVGGFGHYSSHIQIRQRVLSSLPNALTIAGLFFGCEAVFSAINGRLLASAYLITLASIIDVFDGAAARLLGSYSSIGKQLDSIADTVTVGIAPTVLLYEAYFRPWHALGVAVAICWTLAVATRLARFNAAPPDPSYFRGLPSPPAANILSGSVPFSQVVWHHFFNPWIAVALMVVLAVLMLSNVRVEKGGFFSPEQLVRSGRGRLALLACLYAALVPWSAPFVVFSGLVVLVLIREARRRVARRVVVS
ncbi:MAG: CDP-alcohol phosphatidyltransferase family protein [Actinomycetota bacterium]|nr:CDP-alcohol phosphatidyltransferase family protein [Actinomycetota bacterium]